MSTIHTLHPAALKLPTHKDLPDRDGVPVRNAIEPDQSSLLTESLRPYLAARYPENNYFIGQDTGIYWEPTVPAGVGCKAPDWYLVLDVPALLDGEHRRSYVLWIEREPPLIILEYASDGTAEELDQSPGRGKFWVYERRIRPAYYGIFDTDRSTLVVYKLQGSRFRKMKPNEHGRFPIEELSVELGLWEGKFGEAHTHWMRWWVSGVLLSTGDELAKWERKRADAEHKRADAERKRADTERGKAETERQRADAAEQRAARLAAQLQALGKNPDDA